MSLAVQPPRHSHCAPSAKPLGARLRCAGGGPPAGPCRPAILTGCVVKPVPSSVLEITTPRPALTSSLFSRKEEAEEGQALSGRTGAEERHPAHQRAHGGDPGGGRRGHGAVPRGRGRPEVHPHCHEHGESGRGPGPGGLCPLGRVLRAWCRVLVVSTVVTSGQRGPQGAGGCLCARGPASDPPRCSASVPCPPSFPEPCTRDPSCGIQS